MRQLKSGAQGIANTFTKAITENGVLLQVWRGKANPTGKTGMRQLFAIAEAPDADDVKRVQQEGAFNASDMEPYIFTFVSGSDVVAGDYFYYMGFRYQLLNAYPQPLGNAILGLRCYGIRTGKGTAV